jgi:hypothetical protein
LVKKRDDQAIQKHHHDQFNECISGGSAVSSLRKTRLQQLIQTYVQAIKNLVFVLQGQPCAVTPAGL